MMQTEPLSMTQSANHRIRSFRQRFGDGHLYLACHAALPLALTPDLLYRLWATFQRDCQDDDLAMPWIAVSDLLLSGLCDEVGDELYEMDSTVRDALMQQLKASPRLGLVRVRELAEFVIAYIDPQLNSADLDTRDFAQAQHWRALAYKQPREAVQSIATTLAELSFEDTHEWIRMAALVETLEDPLVDFPELLVYVRAIDDFARGNDRSAIDKLKQIVDANQQIQIADVDLPIPVAIKPDPMNLENSMTNRIRLSILNGKVVNLIAISFLMTAIVLGCRSLGWLELTELWMYDQFVAYQLLGEKPDPRILVVGITEEDLQKYGTQDIKINRFVVGDRVLLDSLQRLQKLKPKTIGLDVIRDIQLDSGYGNLLKFLKSSTTTISPCASPDSETQTLGYLPPSGVKTEQQGFIGLPFDRDRVIRRYTLAADSPELGEGQCSTSQSLGLRLAARYLGLIDASESPQGDIQLNESIIPILKEPGVYQSPWSREKLQRGYQIVTHYRSKNPAAGSQVSLSDLLENRVTQKMVEDRVVLMGYVTQSAGDDFETPMTRNQERQLPGVFIHAQATSQILSFVLEKRPLMRSLPAIGDALWIGIWSICGVVISILKGRKRIRFFMLFGIAALGFPYVLIAFAWWIPVVPAVLSFVAGFTVQTLYNLSHRKIRSVGK